MAVEARRLNPFPPQLIPNGDLMNSNQPNAYMFNNNIQMGTVAPYTTTMAENLLPFYQSPVCGGVGGLPANTPVKAESGLTYNLQTPRKRSRDLMNQINSFNTAPPQKNNLHEFSSFLGQEVSLQIQQEQLDIDCILAQHTKKIKMEIEEREKQQIRLLVSAIGERVVKKLNEKDEYIRRMAKLNFALQEKVKSLYADNQLWRELAQSNETAALSLHANLEQLMAHVSEERLAAGRGGGTAAAAADDEAESCCGNSAVEEAAERRRLAGEEVVGGGGGGSRMCRKCGEREASVLLLPCRHLCVCGPCGSTLLHKCPVCDSSMNATVHVNMS